MTMETAKLRSSLSILLRNSGGMFAMSAHFLLLLKNWIKLQHSSYYYKVSQCALTGLKHHKMKVYLIIAELVGIFEHKDA